MSFKTEKARDFSLDNIRFFLIFLVVLAHFLEVCAPFIGRRLIYQIIYTFHMPAFIFIFGYNVRFSPSRILFRWVIPYIIFQSLYIAFSRIVLNNNTVFQYTIPYWLLWYSLACTFYQLILPVFHTENRKRQALSLIFVFIIAFFIGFVDSVGYYLSLSRFFVFLPWFLLGYYRKKNSTQGNLSQSKKQPVILLVSAIAIVLSVLFLMNADLPDGLLFGSYSYSKCDSTVWMRATVFLIAFFWIVFLFEGIKKYLNKKAFLITAIGQNTLPIFLLHGFLVRAIPVYCPWILSSPMLVLLLSLLTLVVFGNKFANKAIYCISLSWLEKFIQKS